MKHFNTAGPCNPEFHYMLPPEPRLPNAQPLIEKMQYFSVFGPPNSGKSTFLQALADSLTAEGRHVAVHFSCETAKPAGDDYKAAELSLLDAIRKAATTASLAPELLPPDPWPESPAGFS